MGKLIRIGLQERRLPRPKRLRWSRLLFLLGMLIIGSTYQHLRRPRGLLSLWGDVSSQKPIRLASRDLPSDETMMVTSKPPPASSEVEGETAVPQASVGRDPAPLSMPRASTPSPPRRTAKLITMTPVNNHSPTAASTERGKENTPTTRVLSHYAPSSGRLMVENHTQTPREEMKSYRPTQARRKGKKPTLSPARATADTYAPPTVTTRETSHRVTTRATARDSETMAIYEVWEANSPKRRADETTPTTFPGIVMNTPIFRTQRAKTSTLPSPSNLVEKDALSSPRSGGTKNSASPWTPVGNNKLTIPWGEALENTSTTSRGQITIITVTGSSPVKTQASTAAGSVRNPPLQPRAPAPRTAPVTHWELAKEPPTAPRSSSVAPKVRATLTTRVQHCVVVESAAAAPSTPSHSPTIALLPEAPDPSPSATLPGWPDPHPKAEYPPDLFSVEERRQGWLVLHIFGMMYVFVALAIVCDEYFVPALGVITEKLQISEDVAGATFMAAGGSAPELFTSLIGVFISHSNVGIGTIVGSAVFNILFVIGTCALFSREILNLTWWPLFRDVSFYILDLSLLIVFFLDSLIAWWESLMLLLAYALYVVTMKWNKQIEVWVKELLSRRPGAKILALGDLSKPDDGAVPADEHQDQKKLKFPFALSRGSSSASLHNSTIRTTIYQLMLHSLDPMGEARPSKDKESMTHEARAQPQVKAESKAEKEEPVELPAVTVTPAPAPDIQGDEEEDPGGQDDMAGTENGGETTGEEGETAEKSGGEVPPDGEGETAEEGKDEHEDKIKPEGKDYESETEAEGKGEQEDEIQAEDDENEIQAEDGDMQGEGEAEAQEVKCENQEDKNEKDADGEGGSDGSDTEEDDEEEEDEEDEEEEEGEDEEEHEEPLSLDWPETRQKQAIYLFLLPIVFPLWLTVPDVRREESRKFFVITFLGSIIWIAMFSYLMVWWAHQVGETIGISEEIMGLTILAAGTSIPDLITSVIVARKGLGDMAVSSSVGSNIFDITVGLPVPWLLFSLINALQPVPVSSNGLFCAIVLLFLMLLFVISSIASCKWRMNKILGFTMFLLYFVFLIISVMLEDRIISCPVSV
ncbi:sodium/potassium/calcium exchanger 1 isoform X2 [Octodon degus]|uniref:Sodium/potassium/calcium exchanger 1 n=1 Tax=Octodon degus TaxID=10160 RepID=A0A6P3F3W5_OCTDE|nr:sodium/potassium/calcium exchanger 1 isoform X2 [Octodon degus]